MNILKYFSENIKIECKETLQKEDKNLEEIRLRVNKPIILKYNMYEKILQYIVTTEDLLETVEHICENSIYAYQKQISSGYITIKEGHRIGITGSVVMENEKVINIKYISSLNFRIARQVIGASDKILNDVLNKEKDSIYNTLIVSPPGAGKTTILRDLVRNLSNGIEEQNIKGKNIGLVDERGEIAASYKSIPQNDIGIRTDIIDNVSKSIGINILVRSMAPEIVAADEIGKMEDVDAIKYAVCSGVKGIFTAHGETMLDLKNNPALNKIMAANIFEKIIFLNPKGKRGEVESIYQLNKETQKYGKLK